FLFFLISHFFTYFLHRANYVFSFDKDIIFFILSASSFLDSFLSWRACSSFLISICIFLLVDKFIFNLVKCFLIYIVIFFLFVIFFFFILVFFYFFIFFFFFFFFFFFYIIFIKTVMMF